MCLKLILVRSKKKKETTKTTSKKRRTHNEAERRNEEEEEEEKNHSFAREWVREKKKFVKFSRCIQCLGTGYKTTDRSYMSHK